MDSEERNASLSDVLYTNAIARDFTINALLYEPDKRLLLDFVNGVDDLQKKRIRCPMPKTPCLSFREDPPRILRAIRFASRLGFAIEDDMAKAMKDNAKHLLDVPQVHQNSFQALSSQLDS